MGQISQMDQGSHMSYINTRFDYYDLYDPFDFYDPMARKFNTGLYATTAR